MGTSAAQVAEVRADIARSRRELSGSVQAFEQRLHERKEEIVDKVSPPRIWHRKTAGVRQRLDGMSETISGMTARRETPMAGSGSRIRGQAQELSQRAGSVASDMGEQTRMAGPALKQRTERSPMAVGLAALGAGFLAATLLPPTEKEREAAQRLRQELEPLKQQATSVGREVAGELQQAAESSAEQLKVAASDAVEQVKQETQSSARQVKAEATDAGAQVKRRASSASRQVKETSTGAGSKTPSRPRRSPRRAPIRAGTSS